MKICFPVQNNEGMRSTVYDHFGSAPFFVVVNTDNGDVSTIFNRDMNHSHGACNPIKALDGQHVDAVVVGGIGAGALNRLNQSGIKVYKAQAAGIEENIRLFLEKGLRELSPPQCCGGHGAGGNCAHN